MDQECKCEQCNLFFNDQNTLSIHIQNKQEALSTHNIFQKHLGQIVCTEESKITIQCFKCLYMATTSIMEKHKKLPFWTFKCTNCSKLIRGIINYKDHMENVHSTSLPGHYTGPYH